MQAAAATLAAENAQKALKEAEEARQKAADAKAKAAADAEAGSPGNYACSERRSYTAT